MSLAFVLGFSLVFISLGASATAIGTLLMEHLSLLGKIAGRRHHPVRPAHDGRAEDRLALQRKAGADHQASRRVFRRDARRHRVRVRMDAVHRTDSERHPRSSPPRRKRSAKACKLLAVYSAGLGVPFIATSLAINKFLAASARIRKHYHTIEVVSGVLMVIVGVLIFTNSSRSSRNC